MTQQKSVQQKPAQQESKEKASQPFSLARFWSDNALSIVLLTAFLLFWLIQALTG